jgi:hypothetical protein
MVKNVLKKQLGLPLGSHFTVTGHFNLSMKLKMDFFGGEMVNGF